MKKNIIKAKIKENLFCEYSYEEEVHEIKNNRNNTVQVLSDAPIHEDLKAAFLRLIPHLAVICEQVPNVGSDSIQSAIDGSEAPELSGFKVIAFSVGGTGENEGVTITGQRVLETEKVLNLNTPFTKFEDDYKFSQELRAAITNCQSEVLQYHEGKRAPEKQLDMFDGISTSDDLNIEFLDADGSKLGGGKIKGKSRKLSINRE